MLNMVVKPEGMDIGQLRRGTVQYCVLALLRQQERYGFELVQALAGTGLIAGEGTLYPLLARLRETGWVATVWRESPFGPPRRYYRLTESGEAALAGFVAQWQRFRTAVDQILMEGASHDPT